MDPHSPFDASQAEKVTLKNGCPLGDKLNSLLLGARGPNLLADVVYQEETAHFNRERIPERVVHAKGGSALGQFVTTSTEISRYTKADLFGQLNRCTQVVARFSHVAGESGIADTARDVRGFAVKFFTKQGNWDLVGNNLPVFFIKDPINFSSLIHSQKRNPRSHLKDPDAFWDFVSMMPESLHTILMLFSDRGNPDGFRHMHGFGVNTFKLVGGSQVGQQPHYAKFHWICEQPIRNLEQPDADRIAGQDPDYSIRDLFTNVARGNFPRWTLKFQVMSQRDVEDAKFNVFDVTKTWPHAQFPLQEIGIMQLEQNPDNYFAQVEQLAFSPANMVPGIEASPDRMLIGRMYSYPDAQRYRLGANYADLPCNKPKCPVFTPTYCDNVTFSSNINGRLPNYLPSSHYEHLKVQDKTLVEDPQSFSGKIGRYSLWDDDNFSQPRVLFKKVLDDASRNRLTTNIANHLKMVVNNDIKKRVLGLLERIDPKLSKMVSQNMA